MSSTKLNAWISSRLLWRAHLGVETIPHDRSKILEHRAKFGRNAGLSHLSRQLPCHAIANPKCWSIEKYQPSLWLPISWNGCLSASRDCWIGWPSARGELKKTGRPRDQALENDCVRLNLDTQLSINLLTWWGGKQQIAVYLGRTVVHWKAEDQRLHALVYWNPLTHPQTRI